MEDITRDEIYNFKSSSSISTNHNSRPRSTYINQKNATRLFKNHQSRSVSPNNFEPIYLEHKFIDNKQSNLKKRNLSNIQINIDKKQDLSTELRQSYGSQQEIQQMKRPKSTNQQARIIQSGVSILKTTDSKQNNQKLNDFSYTAKDQQSTNNSYYNQFYNVSKLLNKSDNLLDTSSILDFNSSSTKNMQKNFQTEGSAQKNNYFDKAQEIRQDDSFFTKEDFDSSKILSENYQKSNYEQRSQYKKLLPSQSNKKNNRKIIISNSRDQINSIQEEAKTAESHLSHQEQSKPKLTNLENQSNKKEQKENIQEDENKKTHTKMEFFDENEVKNISYYIGNMDYEDFKVYTEAQLLSRMDKESLIIRLQILEQENKEIKCHNLHLSSKFKEMLNEYAKFKDYHDNLDRKSLYQKHVQKLADLSKLCHNQTEIILQKNNKIAELEQIIVKKDQEIDSLNFQIANYDTQKQQDLLEIDNQYKQQIKDFIERVDYLNKENRKIVLLEKTIKDLMDKIQEDTKKYLNALDKSEERYKALSSKQTEKEREIYGLKENIKQLESQIKYIQEQNLNSIQDKCSDYERQLQQKELDLHQLNLKYQKQESQYVQDIKELQETISNLRSQISGQEQNFQEREQGLRNQIQSIREQFDGYKVDTINQTAELIKKIESLERFLEEKKQIIETKLKEISQKSNRIVELQKQLEQQALSKQKMKEEHEKEMNKLFQTKQDENKSLTFKFKELKLYYEVEIEKIKKEYDDRVKECSSSANDAKRQYQAMKNNYNQEMEGKETEIEFLKNKLYEEKQKIKDQLESQYKDMIKDMQKRISFLQNELDEQKIEIEATICEDLAVYNRQSKFWKKSRQIREEKYSYKSINSEESNNKEATPLKKKIPISAKTIQNQQVNYADALKVRFQVIARCAAAFEQQQNKIDNLRAQLDTQQKRANALLKQQYIGGSAIESQNIQLNDTQTFKKDYDNLNQIMNEQFQKDIYLDENDLKDLQLAKQVKELREQLYSQKLKNQELQDQFIKKEYELNEQHKLEKKNLQKEFDSINQIKIQQVFEKDILIEKYATKIAELQKYVEESAQQLESQVKFTEKMKQQFLELDLKNQNIVNMVQKEKEELCQMWENRESLPKDLREIENLNQIIARLNIEIKQLKNQIMNINNSKHSTTQGLVFESQLRTSSDFPTNQQKINYDITAFKTNNRNQENDKKNQTSENDISTNNMSKSINIPKKDVRKDYSRPRTKTSIKIEQENQDYNLN
ncbi:hypothetical protein TTHERM_01159970 (macronuclear) [Tetrahymena thermophila SB210]|uniref:Uncharacterized protein n=1 Tax=Tetrahymena thermophila (strain SB210) TaxID=312017 RepID=Q23ND9_TETTS|nr:hypothetical protein TTHERM_01159970 [Tetrahymena thermophila SB210]EAR98043.2 hypothetical protein TTHERM_01159970 [Tetrahymena thermophila SB210]|eukprot:XP_001018288.2 hypothetical protein TTHERM_01159970 [Tetrahymena thermophila SB210]